MNFISSFLHLSSFFFPSSLMPMFVMVEVDAFNLLFLVVIGLKRGWNGHALGIRYDVT